MKERTVPWDTVKPTSSTNRTRTQRQVVIPYLKQWLKKQRANTDQLEEVADLALQIESSTERDSDTTLLGQRRERKGLLLGQTTNHYSKRAFSSSMVKRKARPSCGDESSASLLQTPKGKNPLISIQV